MRLTHEQKEKVLEAIFEQGTLKSGAKAAGISIEDLKEERRRSAIFKKRVTEALREGKENVADARLQFVFDVAEGKQEIKMPQLTANLAILNWAVPGFRGAQRVEGRIVHDIEVKSAVPRPKYDELPAPKITIDNPPKKMLKSSNGGKRTRKVQIYDSKGEYIGTKIESVEEVIEGEVIKESE